MAVNAFIAVCCLLDINQIGGINYKTLCRFNLTANI